MYIHESHHFQKIIIWINVSFNTWYTKFNTMYLLLLFGLPVVSAKAAAQAFQNDGFLAVGQSSKVDSALYKQM